MQFIDAMARIAHPNAALVGGIADVVDGIIAAMASNSLTFHPHHAKMPDWSPQS